MHRLHGLLQVTKLVLSWFQYSRFRNKISLQYLLMSHTCWMIVWDSLQNRISNISLNIFMLTARSPLTLSRFFSQISPRNRPEAHVHIVSWVHVRYTLLYSCSRFFQISLSTCLNIPRPVLILVCPWTALGFIDGVPLRFMYFELDERTPNLQNCEMLVESTATQHFWG